MNTLVSAGRVVIFATARVKTTASFSSSQRSFMLKSFSVIDSRSVKASLLNFGRSLIFTQNSLTDTVALSKSLYKGLTIEESWLSCVNPLDCCLSVH